MLQYLFKSYCWKCSGQKYLSTICQLVIYNHLYSLIAAIPAVGLPASTGTSLCFALAHKPPVPAFQLFVALPPVLAHRDLPVNLLLLQRLFDGDLLSRVLCFSVGCCIFSLCSLHFRSLLGSWFKCVMLCLYTHYIWVRVGSLEVLFERQIHSQCMIWLCLAVTWNKNCFPVLNVAVTTWLALRKTVLQMFLYWNFHFFFKKHKTPQTKQQTCSASSSGAQLK